MSDKFSIYGYYQFESIEEKLLRKDVAFEKKVRRWLCKELGMGFKATFDLPWSEVMSIYYDAQIEDLDYNTVYDIAVSSYLPEKAEEQEAADIAFAESLVVEQEESVKKKKEIELAMEFDMENPDSDLE